MKPTMLYGFQMFRVGTGQGKMEGMPRLPVETLDSIVLPTTSTTTSFFPFMSYKCKRGCTTISSSRSNTTHGERMNREETVEREAFAGKEVCPDQEAFAEQKACIDQEIGIEQEICIAQEVVGRERKGKY